MERFPGQQVLQELTLDLLRWLHAAEPQGLETLVETRVQVTNPKVIEDPHVVVLADADGSNPQLGMLGVLNGLLGPDLRIAAVFSDTGRLVGFEPVKPPQS